MRSQCYSQVDWEQGYGLATKGLATQCYVEPQSLLWTPLKPDLISSLVRCQEENHIKLEFSQVSWLTRCPSFVMPIKWFSDSQPHLSHIYGIHIVLASPFSHLLLGAEYGGGSENCYILCTLIRHAVYKGRQEGTFNNYNEHFNYSNFQLIS